MVLRLVVWGVFSVGLAFLPLIVRISSQQTNDAVLETLSKSMDIPYFAMIASSVAIMNIIKHLGRTDQRVNSKKRQNRLVILAALLFTSLIASLIYLLRLDGWLVEEDALLQYLLQQKAQSANISLYWERLSYLSALRKANFLIAVVLAGFTLILWLIVETDIGRIKDREAELRKVEIETLKSRIQKLKSRGSSRL